MPLGVADLLRARRVLCVQPHYDDNDLGAGGTVAALADAGAEVHYLTVADDLVGVLDRSLSDAAALARIVSEQRAAGAELGVRSQERLDLPDAGEWDYPALRAAIVRSLRRLRPDWVLTVDPWLPREAHRDHTRTGLAVAEACLLFGLPRLASGDGELDRRFEPYPLTGVGFYFTAAPNAWFDVGATRARKHRALDAYTAQFTPEGLARLHSALERKEREWAHGRGFEYGEALQLLRPGQLHVRIE